MGVETTRRGAVITCTIREGETLYRVDQRGPRVVVPGGRIPGVYAGLDAGAVGGCEYVLDSPTGTAIVGRAMLPTPATHELRSIDGRIRIPVKWHGSLEREHTPGVTLTFPVGARWPVGRATLPPEPTLALALTVAERDTRRADSLLAGSAPFYLIHTPQACMIEDCQVPTSQAGWVNGTARSERSGRTDMPSRTYSFTLTPADLGGLKMVGANTWWDIYAERDTWWEGSTTGTWYDELTARSDI